MNDDNTLVKLITDNKGLICSIINKYISYYEFDDLYQVSIIGIIKAKKNYDESIGVKFSTYAYKYILSEVLAFINNSKLIKTSKEYHKLYKKLVEARNILTQKLMKEPSIYELSSFLEIDEALINDVMRYQEQIKSLDEVIQSDDGELTLINQFGSYESGMNIDNISLYNELNQLSRDEQSLIQMRYFEDKTQSEIAKFFGTNQVQISRNEQKVLKKLKNNLVKTQ